MDFKQNILNVFNQNILNGIKQIEQLENPKKRNRPKTFKEKYDNDPEFRKNHITYMMAKEITKLSETKAPNTHWVDFAGAR